MSFVIVGTYLLFSYSIKETYKDKLLGIAELSGNFYLEKDELPAKSHKKVEKEFKRISKESVRLYRANSKEIYVNDTLDFKVTDQLIELTRNKGSITFKKGNRQFLSLLYKDNQGDFVIVVSGVDKTGSTQLSNLKKMLLFFGFLGLSIHFLLTWLLANRTFRPLNKLLNQINSIKGDDWKSRLRYTNKGDELAMLVGEFNYLLDRIESSATTQKNFLKNASHEIKTPLAIIIGDIEVGLNHERSEQEYKELLVSVKENALHLKSVTESLITLSNLEVNNQINNEKVRIDEILFDVLEKKKIEYPGRKAQLNFITGDEFKEELLIVNGNGHLLFVALNNIVDNAFKFSGHQDIRIEINLKEDKLRIVIRDYGAGMPAGSNENIFKLFYRNPENTTIPGHGIGLYLTKQILQRHHIVNEVASVQGEGTAFTLFFP
ncbi:HAMP domain-containing sensor histidine kinase [Flavobacterium cerinum]|uniref:histidine kinase n=1 Tax=Flavobacterium cerinum TaxID=2502784 RepID=A0ABY5IZY0_9FLAO|nr:HAMP domain-containing sensor histidine kinase [Flavobacterium cerinum]UUC46879.1 HAMP domain-containing histidine kinase [Flavobacterium cerinum]